MQEFSFYEVAAVAAEVWEQRMTDQQRSPYIQEPAVPAYHPVRPDPEPFTNTDPDPEALVSLEKYLNHSIIKFN